MSDDEDDDPQQSAASQALALEEKRLFFRRATAFCVGLITLAWFFYSCVFQAEVQDQHIWLTDDNVTSAEFFNSTLGDGVLFETAFTFTGALGALYIVSLCFYVASRRNLVLRDATHLGMIWAFSLVTPTIFLINVGIGWSLVRRPAALLLSMAEQHLLVRHRNNWYFYGFATSTLCMLLGLVTCTVMSGMLGSTMRVAPVAAVREFRRRRRLRRRRSQTKPLVPTNTAPRANKQNVAFPSLGALFASGGAAVGSKMSYSLYEMSGAAGVAFAPPAHFSHEIGGDAKKVPAFRDDKTRHHYDYVHSSHRSLRAVSFLSIMGLLTFLFLFITGFLATLQSQGLNALPNLWAFMIAYGVLGVLLIGALFFALLDYAQKHSELTFRHMIFINMHAATCFLVWAYSLFLLVTWLTVHAPGKCCSAAASTITWTQEPAWTLLNNALNSIGVFSLFTFFTVVPAMIAHAHPEKRYVFRHTEKQRFWVLDTETSSDEEIDLDDEKRA